MNNKKSIISIILIVGVSSTVITIGVTAYVFGQSDDDLLAIMFSCTTGIMPNAFSSYRVYDNGTHTIDMDSCTWIKNIKLQNTAQEFQEINEMSCTELVQRHSTGGAYQSKENEMFAQEKISNCN